MPALNSANTRSKSGRFSRAASSWVSAHKVAGASAMPSESTNRRALVMAHNRFGNCFHLLDRRRSIEMHLAGDREWQIEDPELAAQRQAHPAFQRICGVKDRKSTRLNSSHAN